MILVSWYRSSKTRNPQKRFSFRTWIISHHGNRTSCVVDRVWGPILKWLPPGTPRKNTWEPLDNDVTSRRYLRNLERREVANLKWWYHCKVENGPGEKRGYPAQTSSPTRIPRPVLMRSSAVLSAVQNWLYKCRFIVIVLLLLLILLSQPNRNSGSASKKFGRKNVGDLEFDTNVEVDE